MNFVTPTPIRISKEYLDFANAEMETFLEREFQRTLRRVRALSERATIRSAKIEYAKALESAAVFPVQERGEWDAVPIATR